LTGGQISNWRRMNKDTSPYYPGRARWYSRFFYLGLAVRQRLALDRIRLPKEITIGGVILGFLIPGLAIYIRGPRFWGRIALSACALLFLFFILWLGYPAANLAFGLLISLHATGFVYYCNPFMARERIQSRLGFTILILLAIGLGFYLPIQHTIQTHWLMPLRNGNQVTIISVRGEPASLKRGDWAAFSSEKGVLFGPIVGLGGDQVDSIAVPENHWLIRAQFARRYYEDWSFVSYRSETFEQLTIVSREEFVGKPFKRWFWRKQILP